MAKSTQTQPQTDIAGDSVASMTGFARDDGAHQGTAWTWEVKSVNGRGLDVRSRLGPRGDAMDPAVRQAIARRFARGSFSIQLQIAREAAGGEVVVNRALLEQLVAEAESLGARLNAAGVAPEALLAIRGVVEVVEPREDEAALNELQAALLASLDRALDSLADARAREGGHLKDLVREQGAAMRALCARADSCAATQPRALRQRLDEQLRELVGASDSAVSPERLAQEVALLAAKADVREELDRLSAHLETLDTLLVAGGPIGRQLDFLAQELNREANTLCAKSADIELSRIGLELKAVIDQFREQAQNIE